MEWYSNGLFYSFRRRRAFCYHTDVFDMFCVKSNTFSRTSNKGRSAIGRFGKHCIYVTKGNVNVNIEAAKLINEYISGQYSITSYLRNNVRFFRE